MNSHLLSESSIHYVTGLLDRYKDSYPTKHHVDALYEFRLLSNRLLESLEVPTKITVHRHRLKPDA